ncbi:MULTISPECIES: OadG family transporter subunit [Fusobacterium]|uniref:OadG family transporter subunit n=1 Tax=Fusobacterium TaxID=848 RepID=UPI001476A0F8|nr:MULTISPECIES: OadG family transporter subunit [Fusobacterium]NME36811.1 sodium pump decarboxylase [Fusobacterium sp. FSA-380-WT-3A]
MFAGSTMGIFESIIVSALGLSVVFTALAILAIAIIIFSKIFNCLGLAEEKVAPKVAKPVEENLDEEHCAVIVSAISEELRSKRGNYRIKSIKEIK